MLFQRRMRVRSIEWVSENIRHISAVLDLILKLIAFGFETKGL
jgi:hypothetical protein